MVVLIASWCLYSRVGTLHTIPVRLLTLLGPYAQVLGHLASLQDLFLLVLGRFTLSQDLSSKCGDTSYCPKTSCSSVGILHTVSRPFFSSVGTLRLYPKTSRSSVGTLHTVPRPLFSNVGMLHIVRPPAQVLGHFALSHNLPVQVLGHFALSQDFLFKFWVTSHRPKTFRHAVGTFWDVPRLPAQVLGHFAPSRDIFVLVLGHCLLSKDYLLKCWDTSHCLKTPTQVLGQFALSPDSPLKFWGTSNFLKTFHPSVGTLRAVPRLPAQVLGQSDLFFFGTVASLVLRCWDSRISCSSVLG